jgi:hypothetical protein
MEGIRAHEVGQKTISDVVHDLEAVEGVMNMQDR